MASDAIWAGNTRALARIIKQWQRERNVPLKPFQIERLAIEFLDVWPYSQHDAFWYDWMIHDFLACLVARANGAICMPGTGEVIRLGSDWLSRAQTAHRHALLACDYEYQNYESLAGIEWQAILGSAAPILVR